jgi:hypothetical protein
MRDKVDITVGDNETFVTLMRVAQEDQAIQKTLSAILALEPFQRRSMLSTLIGDMKINGAEPEFVAALGSLLDDEVARRAAEVIKT